MSSTNTWNQKIYKIYAFLISFILIPDTRRKHVIHQMYPETVLLPRTDIYFITLFITYAGFSGTHHASCFCTTRPRTLIRQRRPWSPAHVAPLWQTVLCIYYHSVKRTAFPCHRFHHWRMYPRSNCHQPFEVCLVLRQKIEWYMLYTTYWNLYHCWSIASP